MGRMDRLVLEFQVFPVVQEVQGQWTEHLMGPEVQVLPVHQNLN
jgi:hypothetical protein